MAMFKYLKKIKPTDFRSDILQLPDPDSFTGYNRENLEAANAAILDNFATSVSTSSGTTISKRGVKRKSTNNHYTPDIRAKIGRYALEFGNVNAAKKFSNELNVSIGESTVRQMKKQYLSESKSSKGEVRILTPKKRGRPLLLSDIDEDGTNHIKLIREAGGVISQGIVIATTKGLIKKKNKWLLKENGGSIDIGRPWAISFLRRLGYVKRKGTRASRKIPQQKEHFLRIIREKVTEHKIPPELVINYDQTGLKIVPVSNWTLAPEGSKQVDVIGIEDKREITALLGSSADGLLLPPQLLYTGKTTGCHAKIEFPENWNVSHTENHWSNALSMIEYIENIIIPYCDSVKERLDLPLAQRALVICDVFAAHRCESVMNALKSARIEVVFVPAGCTGELQPMDLCVNGDFKREFTDWYSDWIAFQRILKPELT